MRNPTPGRRSGIFDCGTKQIEKPSYLLSNPNMRDPVRPRNLEERGGQFKSALAPKICGAQMPTCGFPFCGVSFSRVWFYHISFCGVPPLSSLVFPSLAVPGLFSRLDFADPWFAGRRFANSLFASVAGADARERVRARARARVRVGGQPSRGSTELGVNRAGCHPSVGGQLNFSPTDPGVN